MGDQYEQDASVMYDFLLLLQEDIVAGKVATVGQYVSRFPSIEAQIRVEYQRALHPSSDTSAPEESRRIGSYQLLRLLGRGGQGEVYLALDPTLGRRVALKAMTSPLGLISTERRARFRREAQILAQLDHPAVCSIYQADLDGDVPYIAMAFIEGQSLADLMRARKAGTMDVVPVPCSPSNTNELERLLRFFEETALALHAAHVAGVIHRDIKPGNLMVTRAGQPVIVDFGLARSEGPQLETLTRTDDVFGTMAYMAPEQLEQGRQPVDARTDVYSLGVTLFEALTLTTPFVGNGWPAMCRAIQHEPVPDARLRNPQLPAALHAVLATAMDKDPERRYATALEFAEDMARVSKHKSVLGRLPGRALRVTRWAKRSPLHAAAGTVLLLGSLLGTGWLAQSFELANVREVQGSDLLATELARHAREALTNDTAIALRHAYWVSREKPAEGNRLLVTVLDQLWERRRTWANMAKLRVMDVHSPSGLALSGDESGQLNFMHIGERKVLPNNPKVKGARLTWAAFASSGVHAASTSLDGQVQLWSSDCSAPPALLGRHEAQAVHGAFHPNGRWLATTGHDGFVRIWDLERQTQVASLEHSQPHVDRLAFSPDGEWLISSSQADSGATTLSQWNAQTFALFAQWEAHKSGVHHLAFAADGASFLTASDDGTVQAWGTDAPGERRQTFDHGAPVHHFDLDARGAQLLVAHDRDPAGRTLSIWTLGPTPAVVGLALEPASDAREVRFSPDSKRFCVQSTDRSLQLFHTQGPRFQRRVLGHNMETVSFRWAPEQDRIVSASDIRYVHTWYASDRPFLREISLGASPIVKLEFNHEGNRLRATSELQGVSQLSWPDLELGGETTAASFKHASPLGVDGGPLPFASRTLRDGAEVRVFKGQPSWIEVKDARGGMLHKCELSWQPRHAHIGGKGEILLVAPDDWTVELYAKDLQAPLTLWGGSLGAFEFAAFSPDGAQLVSGSASGTLKSWDVKTGALLLTYPQTAGITALTYSPEGSHVAVGLRTGAIKVWPLDLVGTALAASPWYDDLPGPVARELKLQFLQERAKE